MRNLKKFLALVLAVMMVMGLMVTANAAKTPSYTSAPSSDYKSAVEILFKLGVLEGSGGGKYDPQDTIPRSEFAMMVYRIYTGYKSWKSASDNISSATKKFTDIKATDWYAGPVGFCYDHDLFVGSSSKFNGNSDISLRDAFIVLARALGYDANKEFRGTNAYAQAAYYIKTTTIADSVKESADMAKAATREQVAQMVLNTLLSNCVTWNPTTNKYEEKTWGLDANGNADPQSLGELFYDLVISDGVNADGTKNAAEKKVIDDFNAANPQPFGRPGYTSVIEINGTQYGLGKPEYANIFDTAMTEKEIFEAVGAAGIKGSSDYYIVMDTIYVNGVAVAGSKEHATAGQYVEATYGDIVDGKEATRGDLDAGYNGTVIIAKTDTSNTAGFGYGTTVELYPTGTANHYTMVIIKEYLGTVTNVDTDNGTVTISGNGTTYPVEATGYAKDDVVLFNVDNNKAVIVGTPNATDKGRLTKIAPADFGKTIYTIGGEGYKRSETAAAAADLHLTVGAEGEWYLDSHGNIIGEKTATAATPTADTWYYGYLLQYAFQATPGGSSADLLGNGGSSGNIVGEKFRFIDANGTEQILDGAFKRDTAGTAIEQGVAGGANNKSSLGTPWTSATKYILFAYTLNSNGEISKVKDLSVDSSKTYGEASGGNVQVEVKKGDAKLYEGTGTLSPKSGVISTDDTVYIVINKDDSTKNGGYKGYTNVPNTKSIEATNGSLAGAYAADATSGEIDVVVIITGNGANTSTSDPKNAGYVYFGAGVVDHTTEWIDDDTTIWTYDDVYVNGVKQSISVAAGTNATAGELHILKFDADTGLYEFGAKVEISSEATIGSIQTTYYNMEASSGDLTYFSSSTVFYKIDKTAKTMSVITVADLKDALSKGKTITELAKEKVDDDHDGTAPDAPISYVFVSVT